MQQNVYVTQRRNKLNYNQRNQVKLHNIEANQQVRVCDNVRSTKYDNKRSNPRQVDRKINDSNFSMDDGSVRNTDDLVCMKIPLTRDITALMPSTGDVAKP